jgi:hypothetical protein
MADIYTANKRGSRTGSEIIGEGRNPKRQTPTASPKEVKPKTAPVPKAGVHLKRGEYNG